MHFLAPALADAIQYQDVETNVWVESAVLITCGVGIGLILVVWMSLPRALAESGKQRPNRQAALRIALLPVLAGIIPIVLMRVSVELLTWPPDHLSRWPSLIRPASVMASIALWMGTLWMVMRSQLRYEPRARWLIMRGMLAKIWVLLVIGAVVFFGLVVLGLSAIGRVGIRG